MAHSCVIPFHAHKCVICCSSIVSELKYLLYLLSVCLYVGLSVQLIMPGYCVVGTVGHKILSGVKKIEIDKKIVSIVIFSGSLCPCSRSCPHCGLAGLELPCSIDYSCCIVIHRRIAICGCTVTLFPGLLRFRLHEECGGHGILSHMRDIKGRKVVERT